MCYDTNAGTNDNDTDNANIYGTVANMYRRYGTGITCIINQWYYGYMESCDSR
jgi:hypothetical protein